MSNTYDGIELKFTIKPSAIIDVRKQLSEGLEKKPISIRNINVTKGAVDSLKKGIENLFKSDPLEVQSIKASGNAIRNLKNDISESLSKNAFTVKDIKVGPISLKNVVLTNTESLRESIATAINRGDYKLKITKVDASAAIKSVQEQLRAALASGGFTGSKSKVQETVQDFAAKQEAKQDATVKGQRYKAVDDLRRELKKLETAASKEGILDRSSEINSKIHKIAGSIDYLSKRIESMGTKGHSSFSGLIKDTEGEIAALNAMIAQANNPVLEGLIKSAKASNTNISARGNAITDVESLSRLKNAWDEVQQKIREATDAMIVFGESKESEQALLELQKIVAEYSEIIRLSREMIGRGVTPIFGDSENGALGGIDIESLRAQEVESRRVAKSMNELQKVWQNATKADNYNKNITVSDEFSVMDEKYRSLISLHEQYKMATNPKDRSDYAAAIERECQALEREVHDMQKLVLETNKANQTLRNQQNRAAQPASAKSMTNLAGQIQDYLKANSSISKNQKTQGYHSELSGYLGTLRSAISGTATVSNKELDDMAVKFKQTKQAVKDLGLSGQTMMERFLKGFEKFGGWMVITSALMELVNGMHKAVENVFELDAAMTQLRKVTDETETTYQKFYDTAVNRSKEIGSTLSNMINATADFARLGYNITDAQGLAEVANVYMAVGDNISSISDASESIISTLKAFYNETDAGMSVIQQGTQIIDEFNEVGKSVAQRQGRLVA